MDDSLRDRTAEVIVRGDCRRDLVAEPGRCLRRVDFYLELGLLVFLDAKCAAAIDVVAFNDCQAVLS